MTTKLAYNIDELTKIHPGGRTLIFRAIKEGHLKARKLGGRTIVLHDDYVSYLHSLPEVELEARAGGRA